MVGFMEATYENGDNRIRVCLVKGLIRCWENGKLVYRSVGSVGDVRKFTEHWLDEDFIPGYKFVQLSSEDDVENECDCWKRGLE